MSTLSSSTGWRHWPTASEIIPWSRFTHSVTSCCLTLRMSEAGIPALRKLPCGVGSRYTSGTVCQRQASEAGISALFSNSYWHLSARVIELQTRQQLKNNFSHERQQILWTSFAFGHLAANVRVVCSDFSKLRVYAVYSNRHPPSLFGKHCKKDGGDGWWRMRRRRPVG